VQLEVASADLATAQAAIEKAEAEAAALRLADQDRRARGLVARIKAAWRGKGDDIGDPSN
jgi:hypothetical protein